MPAIRDKARIISRLDKRSVPEREWVGRLDMKKCLPYAALGFTYDVVSLVVESLTAAVNLRLESVTNRL